GADWLARLTAPSPHPTTIATSRFNRALDVAICLPLEMMDRSFDTSERDSGAAETELLAERAIAEFDRDLSPLDAPLSTLFDIAVGVTGDAEDRRPHVTLLHDRRDVASARGLAGAGDRDLRVADQVPHDRGRLAVRRGLVAETLV